MQQPGNWIKEFGALETTAAAPVPQPSGQRP
jgi:hypothetical protein